MKGYKAFEPGMICKGKQYAENTVFEEPTAEICKSGMHFCAAPLDVLDYYPIINDNGKLTEFAIVEALDEAYTDDHKKFVTKKLRVDRKISIHQLGKLHAEYICEAAKEKRKKSEYESKQNGVDGSIQVGYDSANQIGGHRSNQIGGDESKQIGGHGSKQIGGHWSKQIGGHGSSQIGGHGSKQIGGDGSNQIGRDESKQIGGDGAKQIGGENCVMIAGENSLFKAELHSIILCYRRDDDCNISGFKAAQIDGVNLMPDTWYKLVDGEFMEVEP